MSNVTPVQKLKGILNQDSVQEQFRNALKDNTGLFVASLIDVYGSDSKLQECEPRAVVMEALKAATLQLPINKNLGFAYIIPYKRKGKPEPQFQPGYKGYIQLAMRTGKYRFINADVVYEGELVKTNKLTGEIDLSGDRESDKIIGYFAYMETVNGFKKTIYWPKEKVIAHAKRYSPAYGYKSSPWQSDFDSMAIKTVLKNLLSHYGILSVEMMEAVSADTPSEEAQVAEEIEENANQEVIDIESSPADTEDKAKKTKSEEEEMEEVLTGTEGPGF